MGLRGRFIVQRVIGPRLRAVPGLGAWLAGRPNRTGPRPEKPRSRTAGAAVTGGLVGSSATVLVAVLVSHGGTMSTLASGPAPGGGALTSSTATTPLASGGSPAAPAAGRSKRPTVTPEQTATGTRPRTYATGAGRPQTAATHSTGCAQSATACGIASHRPSPAPGNHTPSPVTTHPVSTVSPAGHKRHSHPGSRCVRPLIQTGSRCPGAPPDPGPVSGPGRSHPLGHSTGPRVPAPVASTPATPARSAAPVTVAVISHTASAASG